MQPFSWEGGTVSVSPARLKGSGIRVPGSKSLTNRFLLLAALARGCSILENPLESDDTRYMRAALESLGVRVEDVDGAWHVQGTQTWRPPNKELFIGNAGTAMRFLAPALALQSFQVTLSGNERMVKRPIGDLVGGLRALGAGCACPGKEGYPPLVIQGPLRAGEVVIRGDASSQYLSGLLMSLACVSGESRIRIEGPLVSVTYVEMTMSCMRQMGVSVAVDQDFRTFYLNGSSGYQATQVMIETDASTASYWFALPLMLGGRFQVPGVPETSTQGDFGLLDCFAQMGADVVRANGTATIGYQPLRGIDVNMNTMSDVAPTLAVVATRASSPTMIRDVGNMRIKECDRIACIQEAFDRLGLPMESGPDWMRIYPGAPKRPAVLDPQDDHRMAMIFSLLGLVHGGISIVDGRCVEKTYPDFYEEMASMVAPCPIG